MNVVSLFSGIGGLDLGVKLACPDARVVAYVERDTFCQRIIRARIADGLLDDAPIFDDVRTFPPADWTERVDCVIGGWPCQPFSLAGKRQGRSDERHLWPEVARIVGLCRPRYVFGENVPGLISLGLGECLADLAALRFDAEWEVVSACSAGAPHTRERLFILAHTDGSNGDSRMGIRAEHDWNGPLQSRCDFTRIREDWLEAVSGAHRSIDGTADELDRLRALGNAVVPAQAALALRILAGRFGE